MFKVNNKVNNVIGVVLVFLLLTLNIFHTSVSILNSEQVSASWDLAQKALFL